MNKRQAKKLERRKSYVLNEETNKFIYHGLYSWSMVKFLRKWRKQAVKEYMKFFRIKNTKKIVYKEDI